MTSWRLQSQANRRWRALAIVLFTGAACASGVTSAQEAEPENSKLRRQHGSQSANMQAPSGESQNRPARDSYAELARATGGFSYNGPHEYLAEATEILFSVMDRDAHSLAWVTGSVVSPPAIEIPVTVDSTVNQLDFVVSTHANESAVMELRRPDGSPVTEDQGAEFIIIPTAQRVRIQSPTTGEWRLLISGRARFDAYVLAKGGIKLQRIAFLPLISETKTLGPERIGGALPVQRRLRLEVALQDASDPVATITLLDGTPLETVSLRKYKDDPEAARKRMANRTFSPRARYDGFDSRTYYFGEVFFVEPSREFVVIVSGEDPAGFPFKRLLRTVFEASEPPEQEEPKSTNDDTERYRQKFYALLEQEMNTETSADSAFEYLRGLSPNARLALARILSDDPDALIGYTGCQILIARGHIDEVVPSLAAMIVSGRAQTQLNGRMGYDWVHSDDDTLATRMMLRISRHLLEQLDEYDADERRNAQMFLVGPRAPFTAEAARRRIDEMEATLQEIIRRPDPPTSGIAEKD